MPLPENGNRPMPPPLWPRELAASNPGRRSESAPKRRRPEPSGLTTAPTGERAKADAPARARLEAREGDLDMARTQAATAHEALKALRQAETTRGRRGG